MSKNRVMRVATTSNLAEANRVGKRMLAFYREVARGGAGVIVSEATRIHPSDSVVPGALALFDPGVVPGLRKISRAIHKEGGLFIVQLNHGGRQHLGRRVGTLISASAIPCPRSGGTPHALTTKEVGEMVEYFIAAAVNARDAEADGVEIHGAQGHLIGQFMSPYSNTRTDHYGGSPENRMRFAREILFGVRQRLGPEAVIGFRLGVEEFTPGGLTIDDTCQIAAALTADGLCDYVSLSQGNFNTIETHLPDRHWPILAYREIQARIKAAVGPDIPVVQSTRIQTPEQAEEVLRSGEADMIGLCRALIVDPHWVNKAARGEPERIRRCIACNQCWDWISSAEPIGCAVNPRAGREYALRHQFRSDGGNVLVVGAGPAGLEAARVAAQRGYSVTVYEKGSAAGGKFLHSPRFPHNEELKHVTDFLYPEALREGVKFRFGEEATAKSILENAPYAVILATGAEPEVPSLESDGSVPIISPVTADEAEVENARTGSIVVMDEDGYFWSSSVLKAAARMGRRIFVVTRFFEVLRELPMVSRIAVLKELDEAGATLVTSSSVSAVSMNGVTITHYMSGREIRLEDVAKVFWVGRQTSRDRLFSELKNAGLSRTRIIGDAYAPRRLPVALFEAHTIASNI